MRRFRRPCRAGRVRGAAGGPLRPVRAAGGDIVYRDCLQLSLTMNHMVIDGAPGAKFLQTLKDIIENFELVCIAG